MQNQIQELHIPSNFDEGRFRKDDCLNTENNHIGIQLVRFDDDNRRTSSVKVSITPFLVPLSQAVPVFE